MLNVLRRVETVHLQEWLNMRSSEWDTLDIIYEEPFVERLFRPFEFNGETYRVCLHVIHRCEGAPLLHPHPWPAAVKIIKGYYEQVRGIMFDEAGEATITGRETLYAGSEYSMLDPREVHSVSPGSKEVITLMVTGPTWQEEWQRKIAFGGPLGQKAKPSRPLAKIPDGRKSTIVNKIRRACEERKMWDKAQIQLLSGKAD